MDKPSLVPSIFEVPLRGTPGKFFDENKKYSTTCPRNGPPVWAKSMYASRQNKYSHFVEHPR
jgi:hypothetical protein